MQHVLKQVPLRTLDSLVEFIGTFLRAGVKHGTIFQYGRRQSVNKSGCHEVIQRLFLSLRMEGVGSEKYLEECDWFYWHFKGTEKRWSSAE